MEKIINYNHPYFRNMPTKPTTNIIDKELDFAIEELEELDFSYLEDISEDINYCKKCDCVCGCHPCEHTNK